MNANDRMTGEHDRTPGEQDQRRSDDELPRSYGGIAGDCDEAPPRSYGISADETDEADEINDFDDAAVTSEIVRDATPAVSPKVRRHRRTRPRATTIAMKRVSLADLELGTAMYPPVELARPRTRADCGAEARPCPWVACKHHLYLDINPDTGSIKINFPDREPWELEHTCALDIAEAGGKTLDEIGEITNLTRERIRQVEVRGLLKLRTRRELR
jgi:hypothetical protein